MSLCFLLNIYFTVILAWAVYFFYTVFFTGTSKLHPSESEKFLQIDDSLGDQLKNCTTKITDDTIPWGTCGNSWNTKCCHIFSSDENACDPKLLKEFYNCDKMIEPAAEFWENRVLNMTTEISAEGNDLNWTMFVCLTAVWIFFIL